MSKSSVIENIVALQGRCFCCKVCDYSNILYSGRCAISAICQQLNITLALSRTRKKEPALVQTSGLQIWHGKRKKITSILTNDKKASGIEKVHVGTIRVSCKDGPDHLNFSGPKDSLELLNFINAAVQLHVSFSG